MSKIKMTKTFEIDKGGDCEKCKSRFFIGHQHSSNEIGMSGLSYLNSSICLAFEENILAFKQCQACKDFLKAEARSETCTLTGLECRIIWNSKGEPDQLMISFNAENKNRLINAYSKRDIAKLVLKILECEV